MKITYNITYVNHKDFPFVSEIYFLATYLNGKHAASLNIILINFNIFMEIKITKLFPFSIKILSISEIKHYIYMVFK